MSFLTFELAETFGLKINIFRAVKLALVHDLPEVITGDFPSVKIVKGEINVEEKERSTKEAIVKLSNILPSKRGIELYSLLKEFEEQKTKEAKFVKAMDKIETLIQFTETGYMNFHDEYDHIAHYADRYVDKQPELQKILKVLKKEIEAEFKKGNIPWKKEFETIRHN